MKHAMGNPKPTYAGATIRHHEGVISIRNAAMIALPAHPQPDGFSITMQQHIFGGLQEVFLSCGNIFVGEAMYRLESRVANVVP